MKGKQEKKYVTDEDVYYKNALSGIPNIEFNIKPKEIVIKYGMGDSITIIKNDIQDYKHDRFITYFVTKSGTTVVIIHDTGNIYIDREE